MITCRKCHRFVRVLKVEVWWASGDVKRVEAVCKRCGTVDAEFTDYDELPIPEELRQ